MTFEKYQELAIRTLPPATEPGGELHTLALGFSGEIAEFMCAKTEEARIKEMGDCYWYLACIMHRFNNFEEIRAELLVNQFDDDAMDLLIIAGLAGDVVKKHTGHKHKLNVADLADLILSAKVRMERICKAWAMRFEEVAEVNIAKLRKRYPDGFTVEASINRVE